jgi:hypothetical protein
MAGDDREADKPFKVQDRRRFSATGDARPESDDAAAAAPEPAPAVEAPLPPPPTEAPAGADVPQLNFATFLISLSTQALALLGEIPDPVDGQTRVDLDGARQFIDILGMLRDKTRGNLDAQEAALLEGALYDLRMKYVDRAHGR